VSSIGSGHCRTSCTPQRSSVEATLKFPKLQQQFEREGAAAVEMSSSDFAKSIETKIAKWGRVVKEGIIARNSTART
jgi:tripartite-type tricarboxylate transporter receptor subunit TctC